MVIGLSMDSVKKCLEFLGERALSSMSYSVTKDISVHSPHVLLIMLVVRQRYDHVLTEKTNHSGVKTTGEVLSYILK